MAIIEHKSIQTKFVTILLSLILEDNLPRKNSNAVFNSTINNSAGPARKILANAAMATK